MPRHHSFKQIEYKSDDVIEALIVIRPNYEDLSKIREDEAEYMIMSVNIDTLFDLSFLYRKLMDNDGQTPMFTAATSTRCFQPLHELKFFPQYMAIYEKFRLRSYKDRGKGFSYYSCKVQGDASS
ncbi:hypothetical protein C2S53_014013 [Perilla frutescens var. hirtella]|uniref:Uncharacterized protein n=1 Tax=Perilla frutescens var. hirtella TaxID=608512 RepID=A0AAD4IZX1_PERFH|nr:hypothetical protein C2S53_014013 [Perilla frutescens var. hirtella]